MKNYKLSDKCFFIQAKKELEELEQQLASLEKQTDFSRDSSVSLRSVENLTDFSRIFTDSLRSVEMQKDFFRDSST
jgi:hypothetical protein